MRHIRCLVLCLLAAFVFPLAAFAADCVPSKEDSVKKTVGPCEIKKVSGRFTKDTFFIDYSGASLTCGGKTLIDGTPSVKEARKVCTDYDAKQGVSLPYSITQDVVKISDYGNFISIETTNSGYTGGAHEFAVATWTTFNTKTGTPVKLENLFSKEKAAKIVADAKKLFDKKDLAANYKFDPDSFAIAQAGEGKVKVTFAAPHAVEIYRGTVLEVSVITAAPSMK